MKEIQEDLNKWSDMPCSWIGGLNIKMPVLGTFLVVQWLRILLPMQGTRVRSLVQEDTTWRGATKPRHHNY